MESFGQSFLQRGANKVKKDQFKKIKKSHLLAYHL